MFFPVLSESSLAHDSGLRPVALLGVSLDMGLTLGLPFVAPPHKRRGRTHFHPLLCLAHELRNEVVEELIPDLMSESRAELDVERVGESRNRGMESEKGRR